MYIYVVVYRRTVLLSDVFCSAFAGDIGEVLSLSVFFLALLAYYAIGSALGGLKWFWSRVIGPVFVFWTLMCVLIAQPAAVCTVFFLLIELCGIWFSIAAALLVSYYVYHYQGKPCYLYCVFSNFK